MVLDAHTQNLLRNLGANAGLISALVLVYGFALHRRGAVAQGGDTDESSVGPWLGNLLGLCFGAAAVLVMAVPLSIDEGVFFDTRQIVLVLAVLHLPLPGALIATGIALAWRIALGGAGMPAGVFLILSALLIALAARRWRPAFFGEAATTRRRALWFLLIGVALALSFFPGALFHPPEVRIRTFTQFAPIALVVVPPCMLLFGLLAEGAKRLWTQERSLLRANAELQQAASVFLHSQEAIFILDDGGRFVDLNPAFCRLMGFAREELIGRHVDAINGDRHPASFYRAMARAARRNGHWEGELWRRRKDGSELPTQLSISMVHAPDGSFLREVCVSRDLSAEQRHQDELERAVNFDPLTGLSNRRHFSERLKQALEQAAAGGSRVAVCYLDLDDFCRVNERHSHRHGDAVLVGLAQRLRAAVGPGDVVGRLGGDEFVAFLVGMGDDEASHERLQRLSQAVEQELLLDGQALRLSASVGVTFFPDDAGDADALLRHADQAMYSGKELGKGRMVVFDPASDSRSKARRETVSHIDRAIDAGEMVLFFQPKILVRDDSVFGAECLVRWRHPERGLLPPGVFIDEITGTPTSEKLDHWVMRSAVALLAAWQAEGRLVPLSINLAVPTLVGGRFLSALAEQLAVHPRLPRYVLEIELLETETMSDLSLVHFAIEELERLGVRVSIDDFGTGYSSLTYLQQLPAHFIKIDQSFVRDLLGNEKDRTLVQGIINLARTFGRQTVAEGVETERHAELLRQMGCDILQGYGIARPMPRTDLEAWVRNWSAAHAGLAATEA